MAMRCPQCSQVVPAGADDRLPPWCRYCGADFKAAPEATPPNGAASAPALESLAPPALADRPSSPLTWREPTTPTGEPSAGPPAEDESLPETVQRVRRSQRVKQQEQWRARRAGLGAFFGGLAFLAVGAFVLWFNAWWGGRLVVPVRLVMILVLPLGISLAGLYTFLTGHVIVGFNGGPAWDITIGPDGIRRTPVAGLIDGRIWYWHGIEYLEYEEDFTFGTGRTLVVHLADCSRERVRLAPEVTAERLAEAVSAYGKELKLAGAGDWRPRDEPEAQAP